ncbi:MAG: hypothetical protein DMH00_12315 [Acidobacteria bacterium]|nr:MAG: hypothetical protein DMH00_12315 [Acidobacteriota bacterium]
MGPAPEGRHTDTCVPALQEQVETMQGGAMGTGDAAAARRGAHGHHQLQGQVLQQMTEIGVGVGGGQGTART